MEAPNGVLQVINSGKTVKIPKGLKVLVADGINSDGTLNNFEFELTEDMLASREQFEQQIKQEGITDIQKAARFLYIINRSFGAKGETFGTSKSRGIKSAGGIIERISEISGRLDKVLIEHKTAFKLKEEYDKENMFFILTRHTVKEKVIKYVQQKILSIKDLQKN